ncbi:MAG: family phosphatase [Candidatus Taylorbacteria bacterium]|nr:family phosphatase [Candidatus Taylorbacteria bacterium]
MDKNITTFIFDCFKVFLTPPLSAWYAKNISNTGHSDPDFVNIVRESDLGNLSEDAFLDYLLSHPWIKSTKQEILDEIDQFCILDRQLVEVAQKLKSKGYKIALLSNANNSIFNRKVYKDYPEFKELFDKIVISSEVKMLKPDPEIYLYTLDFIDSKPEEAIFVDDNIHNVEAAEQLGIKSFVYTDVQSFIQYLENERLL